MDPLQLMGAVGMRVQTPDQNIAIIHMTPVNHLTSCKAKSCVFVRNFLSIIVMFLSAIWTLFMTAPIHCRGSNSPFSYMKNAGNQVVSCPIDFHDVDKKYNGSQWDLKLFGYQHSSKYLILCSTDEINAMQKFGMTWGGGE